MARTNGGITGKRNVASFGKCKQTVKTSSGNVCTQPGTRLVKTLIVAGGGGGGTYDGTAGTGGAGGGGAGSVATAASTAGTVNTGGGGGGTGEGGSGAAGGKGVVILSMPTANYTGTTTGSPTVTTSGSNTILQFTGSGSYTK